MLAKPRLQIIGESELQSARIKLWYELNDVEESTVLGDRRPHVGEAFRAPKTPDHVGLIRSNGEGQLAARIREEFRERILDLVTDGRKIGMDITLPPGGLT